jgi:hypothetical protein
MVKNVPPAVAGRAVTGGVASSTREEFEYEYVYEYEYEYEYEKIGR